MSKIFFEKLTDTEQEDVRGSNTPRRVCQDEGVVPLKCGVDPDPDYINCNEEPLGQCWTPSTLSCE